MFNFGDCNVLGASQICDVCMIIIIIFLSAFRRKCRVIKKKISFLVASFFHGEFKCLFELWFFKYYFVWCFGL
jgi:hypothetical protein